MECHGGKCHARATACHLFGTPGNFLGIFYCSFVFLAKERSPKILVEINLGLCSIQGHSIFSCIHLIHFIVIT